MDPLVDSLTEMLEQDMNVWMFGVLGVGVVALIFSLFLQMKVAGMDAGNERMQKLANAIQQGAMAFLKTQYTILAGFAAVLAIVLAMAAIWFYIVSRR